MRPLLHRCPVCDHSLHVTKLQCSECETTIENDFSLSKFAKLTQDQLQFIETFLMSRGNIKEVEKALNISYPTVRAKLNEVIAALGYHQEENTELKADVIDQLEKGEITYEQAMNLLKK